MTATPTLTICVPSRNRQYTFKETIRSLVISPRMDIQFVFADNSDDPAIMDAFMKDILGDPRVTYLRSAERVYPMNENWERCIDAATGDFICVIGDDDYVDPDVADVLADLCANEKDVDVFVWNRLAYNWPDNRDIARQVAVPLLTSVAEVRREHLFEEFFSWKVHGATPQCPFSIYHGAVSRRVMQANKARFGGKHFGHLTVDFETSCKLLVNAKRFFHCQRAFSVLGACFASNSGTVGKPDEAKRRYAAIMAELGRNPADDRYMIDFPFHGALGVAAAVAQVQEWFCVTFGVQRPHGWEENFAKACAIDCGRASSESAYNMMVDAYREAFRKWRGGLYMKFFKPKYKPHSKNGHFLGINAGYLYVEETIGGVTTPADLYHLTSQVMVPVSEITYGKTKRQVA